MSEFKTYEIKSLSDFVNIPIDRLADCLIDFVDTIAVHQRTARAAKTWAESNGHKFNPYAVQLTSFTWIDDGVRGIKEVQIVDGDADK